MGFSVGIKEYFSQLNYDFSVIVAPGEQMVVRFTYNRLKYSDAFIQRVSRHFGSLVSQVVESREVDVFDLDILSEEERREMVEEFNDTGAPYPHDCTLDELFEKQAQKTRGAVALYADMEEARNKDDERGSKRRQVTYAELSGRVNCLAEWLQAKGVRENTIVALRMERSAMLVAAMLAVLRAGALIYQLTGSSRRNGLSIF